MYYIGLDVHKKTISYCVKDVSSQVHRKARSQQRDANSTVG
jgi:transposase